MTGTNTSWYLTALALTKGPQDEATGSAPETEKTLGKQGADSSKELAQKLVYLQKQFYGPRRNERSKFKQLRKPVHVEFQAEPVSAAGNSWNNSLQGTGLTSNVGSSVNTAALEEQVATLQRGNGDSCLGRRDGTEEAVHEDSNVQIFTEEFLVHNTEEARHLRALEKQLKTLRESNALLLEQQAQRQELFENAASKRELLVSKRASLRGKYAAFFEHFKNVRLPTNKNLRAEENTAAYVDELCSLLTQNEAAVKLHGGCDLMVACAHFVRARQL